jgi:hypothetical protein
LFQTITVKYPATTPLRTATTIIAKYIIGIIGSTLSIVVRYIETTPVIPVATVRSKINLLDLTYFSFLTEKKEKRVSIIKP